jgi:hypothetical protein
MSATNAPFGLIPTFHPSGRVPDKRGVIASTYGTNIFMYSPVKLVAAGVLQAAAAGDAFVGTFLGVEYTDQTGLRIISNFWPASTTATDVFAYYTEDPYIQYRVQADGSLAATTIGESADFTNIGGSTVTGYATSTMSATTGASQVKQLQIRDLWLDPANAWGDAFTVVVVSIANHQFTATINSF